MKKLIIEWQYYAKDGKTCNRCSGTGKNLHELIDVMKQELKDKNIDLELRETKLSEDEIPQSNTVLIDGIPIEEILPNAAAGMSECCSCGEICGKPTDCKTVNVNGQIFEEIPTGLIREVITKRLIDLNYLTIQKGDNMKIQVFGLGCESCKKLYEVTKTAVSELGIKSGVEYITDVTKMAEAGFITSPVLAIDGKAVVSGFVPKLDQIKEVIQKSQSSSKDKCCGGGCSCGGNC